MKPFILILFFYMLLTIDAKSQDGATIFKKNCAVCHSIGKGKLVGPDLKGTDKKHDIKWLIQWIKSSQSMVKKNDPTAVKIFNDNNKMIMPDQALSDEDIKVVISFVGEETARLEQPPPPVAALTNRAVDRSQSEKQPPDEVSAMTVIYLLVGINVFLVLLVCGLSSIIKDLANNNKEWLRKQVKVED